MTHLTYVLNFLELRPAKVEVPRFVESWQACYLGDDRLYEYIHLDGTVTARDVDHLMESVARHADGTSTLPTV